MWYWNEDNSHVDVRGWVRFPNWNSSYTYTFAINSLNSNSQKMYVDSDKRLWVDYTGSVQNLHLLETYGIGQAGGSTYHAVNLGDEQTVLYHRYDNGHGNPAGVYDEYFFGNAAGTYDYGKTEAVLQKFTAYVPLHPIWGDINQDGIVSVADVMALVDWVLGQEIETLPKVEADLNEDGSVSVADVMMLVDYLLLH